ncbi:MULTISPECIES: hypothetical protein [Sulfitobacter]|uniref:alpha/beta hydrolase family protein n=1 Tax=Sulfitobacter TaxID=60136 RepID=UPI002307B351|nr:MULTISPECIES: hypothetical protein [Sulfitobacter]MDF3383118.1 hypothetical protein [Sulfitobacter sp. Ks11]MDF3386537.1 hypothetical protein [Sulfitobacter sp. M85]MDF3389956.1 hypothetical protein [Sulfitobacter sp. Ks16]MDF3400593.1 hypothetical protein [Sulfitobacter sp. KE39]MDF3404014.1 hypothetical protein [Sulfitobacter sp. Ks35]
MKFSLSLALILAAGPSLAQTVPGLAHLRDTSENGLPLSVSIWYPSEEKSSGTVGGNPVFEGVAAAPNAEFTQSSLPLVILSHGGLRSATDSGAWLSSSIARAGFVVAEVNAQRPDNAEAAVNEIWQRPQNISRAIDLVLADSTWGPRIDETTVSVAGFALGATAALSVGGAELDVTGYLHSCAPEREQPGPDCGWFAAQGVDMSATNPDGLAGMARDPRVTSVIAINPEYSEDLGSTPADVRALSISLGELARTLADGQPAPSLVMPQASAFDGFAACTVAGPKILMEEEGDASICGGSLDARRAIHKDVSDAIISFLNGGPV